MEEIQGYVINVNHERDIGTILYLPKNLSELMKGTIECINDLQEINSHLINNNYNVPAEAQTLLNTLQDKYLELKSHLCKRFSSEEIQTDILQEGDIVIKNELKRFVKV